MFPLREYGATQLLCAAPVDLNGMVYAKTEVYGSHHLIDGVLGDIFESTLSSWREIMPPNCQYDAQNAWSILLDHDDANAIFLCLFFSHNIHRNHQVCSYVHFC